MIVRWHRERDRIARATTLVVAAVLCGEPSALAQVTPPAQNPLAGAQVFGAKGCAACHAARGDALGPDLAGVEARRSLYDLGSAVWNHLPRMGRRMREQGMAPARLDALETGDLIAFLFSVDYFDPPGDAVEGRTLFGSKRCVLCHQVGGVGGVVGPSLDHLGRLGSTIEIAAVLWNHGPDMSRAMRARGIERPTFTGRELTDLLAYLGSESDAQLRESVFLLPGRAEQGRELFAAKSCIECHRVAGRGGRVGPELAAAATYRTRSGFAAALWNKAPAMEEALRARGLALPSLEPWEMADIVAYLEAVRYFAESGDARRGEARIREGGCLSCHSLAGRGGDTALDLERIEGLDSAAAVLAALWNHVFVATEADPDRWPLLSAEATADLAAFLQRQARSP